MSQLSEYIQNTLRQGFSQEQIQQTLLQSGYSAEQIQAEFSQLAPNPIQHRPIQQKRSLPLLVPAIIFLVAFAIIGLIALLLFQRYTRLSDTNTATTPENQKSANVQVAETSELLTGQALTAQRLADTTSIAEAISQYYIQTGNFPGHSLDIVVDASTYAQELSDELGFEIPTDPGVTITDNKSGYLVLIDSATQLIGAFPAETYDPETQDFDTQTASMIYPGESVVHLNGEILDEDLVPEVSFEESQDEYLRAKMIDLYNAIDRYYAVKEMYPWPKTLEKSATFELKGDLWQDSSYNKWLYELVDQGELRPKDADSIISDQAFYLIRTNTNKLAICFLPESEKYQKKAENECSLGNYVSYFGSQELVNQYGVCSESGVYLCI